MMSALRKFLVLKLLLGVSLAVTLVFGVSTFLSIRSTHSAFKQRAKAELATEQSRLSQAQALAQEDMERRIAPQIAVFSRLAERPLLAHRWVSELNLSTRPEEVMREAEGCLKLRSEKTGGPEEPEKILRCLERLSHRPVADAIDNVHKRLLDVSAETLLTDPMLLGIEVFDEDGIKIFERQRDPSLTGGGARQVASDVEPEATSITKVMVDGDTIGQVHFRYSTAKLQQLKKDFAARQERLRADTEARIGAEMQAILRRNTLQALTLLVLLVGAVMIVAIRTIMRPIQILKQSAQRIAEGQLDGTIDVERDDELGSLAKAFASMRDSIRAQIQETERVSATMAAHAAIVRTTQMVAHDVRKPFSKMRSGLALLASARDAQRIQDIAGRLVPEVDAAMASINNMITDVLEIDADAPRSCEWLDLTQILQNTLEDIFRTYLNADVTIDTSLEHRHLTLIDAAKMQRVFQNILENALQAIGGRGRIWIRTASVEAGGKTWVAIKLGNAGSEIREEDTKRVFDIFFTSGKKGGTGLGLAIAKKIVEQHGGTISCQSSAEIGVEFAITIPAGDVLGEGKGVHELPSAARDYRMPLASRAAARLRAASDVEDLGEPGSERSLAFGPSFLESLRAAVGEPLRIMMVDDETIYLDYLRHLIEQEPAFDGHMEVATLDRYALAVSKAEAWRPHLAILDVDLHDADGDGYALTRQLRTMLPSLRVCIHSNRISAKDGAVAIAAGADAFIPKPMMLDHLVRFLKDAFVDLDELGANLEAHATSETSAAPNVSEARKAPVVAIVEDDIFVSEAWEDALGAEVSCCRFEDPVLFRKRFADDAQFREQLTVVVLDYHFDGFLETGVDIARELRGQTSAALVLTSDAILAAEDRQHFDGVCGKEVMSFAALKVLARR